MKNLFKLSSIIKDNMIQPIDKIHLQKQLQSLNDKIHMETSKDSPFFFLKSHLRIE